jgi:lysophospholipase L1-like esterase
MNVAKPFLILFMGLLMFGPCDHSESTEDSTAPKDSAAIPSKRPVSWAYETDGWQLRRHAELNKIARRGDIDLVFLGDSITQRWQEAGREVWDKYYARRKAANFGMDGDHTQHVLWRIEHGNFEGIHPKAIIILIGDNNSIAGEPAQEIADGVIAVVRKIREKVPESKILLLAIFPSGERRENPQRVRSIAANTIFRKVADGRMIRYLDIGDRFTKRDGTISKIIMPDFDHLSPSGYGLWADAIEPVVKDLLGEK